MGVPRRLLGADEQVIVHTRTHGKALIGPAVLLVLLGAGAGAALAVLPPLLPAAARPIASGAVLVLAVVLGFLGVLRPFLRWATTTFTITDRRLMTRRGILNRIGTNIPLQRVTDVSSERSLSDRVFGCGTLIVQTAAEGGAITLADVPDVEHVQTELTDLLFSPRGDRWDDRWDEPRDDRRDDRAGSSW